MNFKSLREFDSAITYAERVIELVPEQANPYDTYALMLLTKGRYREAAENFQKALSINPRLTYTHDVIARLYAYLGDSVMFDRSISARMQLEKSGERSSARYDAAYPYRYSGEFSRAVEALQDGIRNDSIEVEPASSGMYPLKFVAKSWAYSELGFSDSAMWALERAIESKDGVGLQSRVVFVATQSMLLANNGDLAGARNALDTIVGLIQQTNRSTTHAIFETANGWLLYHEGFIDSAVTHLRNSAELDIEFYRPTVEFYLAQIYIETGRPQEAIPLLKSWTERIETLEWQEPEMFVKANYFLGRAFELLDDRSEALKRYNEFLDRWGASPDKLPLVEDARERVSRLTS
jgi:tetratricopeptide (TPR) repeat protein